MSNHKATINLSEQQERVLNLLRKYGQNVYSFEILEPGLSYWFSADGDAVVGYVDRGFHWVSLCGPVCAEERIREISNAFAQAAKEHLRGTAFFSVTQRFVTAMGDNSGFDFLQIGEQPCWDPRRWSEVWEQSRKVRNRVGRAKREGVSVRVASASEFQEGAALRSAVDALVNRWIEGHAMPPMQFMATLDLFSHAQERRYFVAEHGERLVGVLMAVPIYGNKGWLLEDMIMERGTASGTSEALVDLAMRTFGAEGAPMATLGLVALSGLPPGRTWRHVLFTSLFNWSYNSLNWLYGFQGLHAYRSKFLPNAWEPLYLAAHTRITFITIRAVLMAFAGGWVPSFGLKAASWWVRRHMRQK